MLPISLSLLLLSLLFSSCCWKPNLTGKWVGASSRYYRADFKFLTDSTVVFYRTGWMAHQDRALARWQYIDPRLIRVSTEFTHQNMPIDVKEDRIVSDSLRFILLDHIHEKNTDPAITIWLCIGDKRYKFDEEVMSLSRDDLGELNSFYLVAEADQPYNATYGEVFNFNRLQTTEYMICNTGNNRFEISLPDFVHNCWSDAFYFREIDLILKVKQCGKALKWTLAGEDWLYDLDKAYSSKYKSR